jgi:hypothetical protein
MEDRTVFISSCSRRQLVRRRVTRGALRLQVPVAMLILAMACAAFVAARIGM